jgi:hypothetical protein
LNIAEINNVNMELSRVPKRILNYKPERECSKVGGKINWQRKLLMGRKEVIRWHIMVVGDLADLVTKRATYYHGL